MHIPEIPEEDTKNPTVNLLVEMLWTAFRIIQEQTEQIELLKDEIAKLKDQNYLHQKLLTMPKTNPDQITLLKEMLIIKTEKRLKKL